MKSTRLKSTAKPSKEPKLSRTHAPVNLSPVDWQRGLRRQIDRRMGAGELGFFTRLGSGFQARGFHRNTFGSRGDSRGTPGNSIPASSEFRAGPSGRQGALPCDSKSRQVRAISRRDAPEVWIKLVPPKDRGRRESRVRAAPAGSRATCAYE